MECWGQSRAAELPGERTWCASCVQDSNGGVRSAASPRSLWVLWGGGSRLSAPICCSWSRGRRAARREGDDQAISGARCPRWLVEHDSWCHKPNQSRRYNQIFSPHPLPLLLPHIFLSDSYLTLFSSSSGRCRFWKQKKKEKFPKSGTKGRSTRVFMRWV